MTISRRHWDCEPVGTSSRQKQKFTHTVGSRSFASVAEAEEVSSGQKVRRLQLFEITHRKKDGFPMTSEAGEIMEKLKEKKAEYEAIASTDSSVNLENIDNRIITEVLGRERFGRIPQMQVSTVEQIAKVQRKYEELQQQLRADTAAREAEEAAMAAEQSRKYDELQLQLQLQHMMKIKGWILVKNVYCKSAKISGTSPQTPLKAMTFSGDSPTNAAKGHDF
ncbi:hypothetical protein GOBAR_AA38432 [Gossypium barbadense]|uniref:Uncharacterized protein n=1 Tax=Gossypium barbadense TaxID=3634 RepID=A0A2P5VTW5_GOSBA|nr:hypothetical protein GOBAR_AA38432 [Gossypium barbadense]